MKSNDNDFTLSEEAIEKGINRVSRFEKRRKIAKSVGGAGLSLVALFAFSRQIQSNNLTSTKPIESYEISCKRIQDGNIHTTQFTLPGNTVDVNGMAEKSCGISQQNLNSTHKDPNLTISGELKTSSASACAASIEIWIDSKMSETFCLKM